MTQHNGAGGEPLSATVAHKIHVFLGNVPRNVLSGNVRGDSLLIWFDISIGNLPNTK